MSGAELLWGRQPTYPHSFSNIKIIIDKANNINVNYKDNNNNIKIIYIYIYIFFKNKC